MSFCQVKQTHIRFPGDAFEGDSVEWDKREEDWKVFWASRGKERLEKSGKAAVDGPSYSFLSFSFFCVFKRIS